MDGMIVSVSHGEGDTIPEDLEEDPIPPNFKVYMLEEQLKWSRYRTDVNGFTSFGWFFWSEQDHEIEPSLSLDNCPDFNPNFCAIPKVKYNIRHALEKLTSLYSRTDFYDSLIQFWVPTKTLEGRTRLTTQYQPFAFGHTWTMKERQHLCEYKMKMCSSEYNNFFYADAESGEEQLGLPGRVFRNQFPEATPYVKYYSTKEYPQRDLALRCKILESWAVPVFEHSSQTCVGVLEMVSLIKFCSQYLLNRFSRRVHDILQEFGLRCLSGNQACNGRVDAHQAPEDEFRKKAKRDAYQELMTGLRIVCEIHELPMAMTWVPCTDCNGLRRYELESMYAEFCLRGSYRATFLRVSKWNHLRKGWVARRALSSLNMLYCSDISKLSLDEYPLVPFARLCQYSGWFTICLQNVYTGNDIYVLEFFLSDRSKDDENILTTLRFILGTMEKNFKTFRLASGKELGELMSIDIIYFQNDQKIHREIEIQATRDFSWSSIPSSVQSSASVAYTGPGFQGANKGIIKAKYDPNSNPFSNLDLSFDYDSDPSFEQSSTSVANTRPGFQNSNMVIIIAKYVSSEEEFELSLPCRLEELQQEVTERLRLEAGTYHAFYEDEEDRRVLIGCDEDLQKYVKVSMSQGNAAHVVLLELKEPTTNLNPTN